MKNSASGFTLIETMVAISLLMLALIAPMSLAAESLTAAYYSRSQITAFYLAQEGIEVVRSVRDANILSDAEGHPVASVFTGIPYGSSLANASPFTADALLNYSPPTTYPLHTCAAGGCPPLQTTGTLYGYAIGCEPAGNGAWSVTDCAGATGWTDTTFTRSIKAYLVNSNTRELRVSVTVKWVQGARQSQSFTINEDLYAWISGS